MNDMRTLTGNKSTSVRIAATLLCLFGVSSCSDGNVEIDHSRLVQQSDELRLDGRCTASAFPPNQDTHLCGMTASNAYTVTTTLRTKSTGRVETKTSVMNKCEEHYMDPDKVERDLRRTYANLPPASLIELVSIDVSVKPLD